jgi:DmsE family decaheme c-type cytochrome
MTRKHFFTLAAVIVVVLLTMTYQRSEGDEGYVGSETCLECHDDWYDSYTRNYHAIKGDPRTPGAKKGCESCHGPGAIHTEEEGEGPILGLSPKSPIPAAVKNAPCLECHTKGKVALWHGSTHEIRELSCASCHNPHQEYPKGLRQPTQTKVCNQCHKDINAQLLRQSRHPIRERKMKCSDCHNSHGTIADNLVAAQYENQKCFECHANLRGPFLWDHPPVIEDCLSCHTPHGSARTPLLKAKMPYLCQKCHSNVGHSSQLQARRADQAGQSVYRVLNNRGFYRACLNCHIQVHGSNHPSGKSLLR